MRWRLLGLLLCLMLPTMETPARALETAGAATPCAATDFQQVYRCDEPSVLRLHVAHLGGAVSEGSSFVVAADSGGTYLLTNEHVVLGATTKNLRALAPDGVTSYPILAVQSHLGRTGTLADMAVVKLPPTSLRPLTWGRSDALQVGQPVASIGYGDPFDLTGPPSFTEGIVSQVQRDLGPCHGGRGWIQHQTPINHGNSGGPLVDNHGNVVGVNTLSLDETNACGSGPPGQALHELYFAIPAKLAKAEAATLVPALQHGQALPDIPRPLPAGVRYGTYYFSFLAPSTWIDADKYATEYMKTHHITTFSGPVLPGTPELPLDWVCIRDVNGVQSDLACREQPYTFYTADLQVSVVMQAVAFPDSAPRTNGLVAPSYFESRILAANTLGDQRVVRARTTTTTQNGLAIMQTTLALNNTASQIDAIAVMAPGSTHALFLLRAIAAAATARDIAESTTFLNSARAHGIALAIHEVPDPLPPVVAHSAKFYAFQAPASWTSTPGPATPQLPMEWLCQTIDADRIAQNLPCYEPPISFTSPDGQVSIEVQPGTYPTSAPRLAGAVARSYFEQKIIAANTKGALAVAASEMSSYTVNGLPVTQLSLLIHLLNTAPAPATRPEDVFAVAPAFSAHALFILRGITATATTRDIEESNIFLNSVHTIP